MTDTDEQFLAPLPGGPYDIDFYFEPGCPFAWQTSVWIRRVQELKGIAVGWRFISLKFINEGNDLPEPMRAAQERGLRYHRICAAARADHGNEAVGALYRAWGERYWYGSAGGELVDRLAEAATTVEPAEILASLELPATLLDAADDDSWDATIRAESDDAMRRAGPEIGTPIIAYDPPHGNTLFGPVISAVPGDEEAVAFYDALRTFVDFPAFSELKRGTRPDLDLPLLTQAS